jgi:hypothetical protein
MAESLFTNTGRFSVANRLIDDVGSNTEFLYFFVGNHDVGDPDQLFDEITLTSISAYRNMIQGKRVAAEDICPVTRNIPWESGKIFDMYDDQDDIENLFLKDYYAVINAGSFSHVFKCLDNSNNAQSTTQPDFSHIVGANTILYQTADGYRWKYLYSVDSEIVNNFATTSVFPVVPNTDVEAIAANGAVDVVFVANGGRGYDNYTQGTFGVSDIRIEGNNRLFGISTGTNVSSLSGFYTGCILYISAGLGIGEYREVSDYIVNNAGNFVVTNNAFLTPENSSQYQIYPKVTITGDGLQTTNAVARALINALASNAVYRVEMLHRGQDYFYTTANVVANAVVAVVQNATVRPIYSPPNGHGANVFCELPHLGTCFHVTLANSEGNTLLTTGQYKSFGFIKNPTFSNVEVSLANANGVFLGGESIYHLDPYKIGSATLDGSNLFFTDSDIRTTFSPNTAIFITVASTAQRAIVFLREQVNTTWMIVNTISSIQGNCEVFVSPNTSSKYSVMNVGASILFLSNVSKPFEVGDFLVGEGSGATAVVNSITRNHEVKGFDTFIECFGFISNGISGTFQQDEAVDNNELTKTGSLYAAVSKTIDGIANGVIVYTTNQVGIFSNGDVIVGDNSAATAEVAETLRPEIDYGSGKVLYISNMDETIQREASQIEAFKIILK